jgi:hypothetical protein
MSVFSNNLIGPGGRLFGELKPSPDEHKLDRANLSSRYYDSPYYKTHLNQVVPFDVSREPAQMSLAHVVGDTAVEAITKAGKIAFHAVGDAGASAKSLMYSEAHVADSMTTALDAPDTLVSPSFFYHLGDVVYQFGEAVYYYDQFYEPWRDYDRPIFAIAGNHDGIVFGTPPAAPASLDAFRRNFCAETPGPSPDSLTLVRWAMDQPGVYFTLEAPFLEIIGLYSNVLEGDGVISSQQGRSKAVYPNIADDQWNFLVAELERLKAGREAMKYAVILAVHHPPVSSDTLTSGWVGLDTDITAACTKADFWPDLILSGHAHWYERYTRTVNGQEIPCIIAGSGSRDTRKTFGPVVVQQAEYKQITAPIFQLGYVTVTVDMSTPGQETLQSIFTAPLAPTASDPFTLNLQTRELMKT